LVLTLGLLAVAEAGVVRHLDWQLVAEVVVVLVGLVRLPLVPQQVWAVYQEPVSHLALLPVKDQVAQSLLIQLIMESSEEGVVVVLLLSLPLSVAVGRSLVEVVVDQVVVKLLAPPSSLV
jgi:hypothetical protein